MILRLNQKEYGLFKKYVAELFEGEKDIILDDDKCEIAVNHSDIEELLIAADDAIVGHGMVNQDYLTDLGCKLQLLYDEIYYQIKNQ